MEDKRAAKILMDLLDKPLLNKEEKEAIKSAIGFFSWSSLAKNRLKAKKAKLDKSILWQK